VVTDRSLPRAAAAALRFELDLGHGLVDPFEVAARLGIELVRFPVPDGLIEGMYRPDGGGYVFVNSGAAFVRQRFTAAHELGHHRLHGDQTLIESSFDEPDDWEANCFAEAFLVDPVGLGRMLAEGSEDVRKDVSAMAAIVCDSYWVSQSAAGIILRHFDFISQAELDSYLARNWTYATLLREHGFTPRPEPERGITEIPSQVRDRVLGLVSAGQLAPERAASMLGRAPEELEGLVQGGEPDPLGASLLENLPDRFD
jgi:Zn-dependent peptidase ImmA (M78 family)